MQRKVFGAVLLTVGGLLLAACGNPGGVDGNLANNWTALPEAKIPVPPVGACYDVAGGDPTSVTKLPPPVDCTSKHTIETVYVGEFTGEDAERGSPPPAGGPGRRRAYETCATQARSYLGDDWRTGRLDLAVVTPIALHWEAKARWYRCDVIEYKDLDDYEVVSRTSSLKDGLAGDRPVGLGCVAVTVKGDAIDRMTPTPCTTPHNGEFAGIHEFPDGPWPSDSDATRNARLDGCRAVVATFAGIPNDSNFVYRTGHIATPFAKADWEMGNRGVRCWIWRSSKNVTGSLKGVGPSGLPINYA